MKKYSFIICTLNRQIELKQAVQSIINQTYDNYEIIIMDQSDYENREIELYDDRIKYYYSDVKGLSKNRNIGIERSSGDYVCIMDDDATYALDSLKKINAIVENTEAEMIGGIILDPISKDYYVSGSNKQKKGFVNKNQVMSCCSSAALVITRELALKIKFDERLGAGERWGSGEEIDFILRALYEENRFYFLPDFVVYHPSADKKNMGLKKAYSYSLGYGALCAKHYYLFGNSYMIMKYIIAIIKHTLAIVIYFFKQDKYFKDFYITSLNGKKKGFDEFKTLLEKEKY